MNYVNDDLINNFLFNELHLTEGNGLQIGKDYFVPFGYQKRECDENVIYRIDMPGFSENEVEIYDSDQGVFIKAIHEDEIFGKRILHEQTLPRPKNTRVQKCVLKMVF